MARPKPTLLTRDQDRFVRMEANGWTTEEIIQELFGLQKGDPEYHKKACLLSRWRKHPAYMATWQDEIKNVSVRLINKGIGKLMHQMDSRTEWLANKAANDGLNFAKTRIFGEEDKAINVRIEGLPEIGAPDQDET